MNANLGGPPIEKYDWVVRLAGGVAWSGSWGALTFSVVQDSHEFRTQHTQHHFGMLEVRLDFL
jgi:hypothetical protein